MGTEHAVTCPNCHNPITLNGEGPVNDGVHAPCPECGTPLVITHDETQGATRVDVDHIAHGVGDAGAELTRQEAPWYDPGAAAPPQPTE